MSKIALAGVARWIEHWPANHRVAGLIPSQGIGLGCGPGPQWGVRERQPHTNVSVPFCLPPFPSFSRNKINKIFKKMNKIIQKTLLPQVEDAKVCNQEGTEELRVPQEHSLY